MKTLIIIFFILTITITVNAQSTVIFKGLPLVKIYEGGVSRISENIEKSNAVNLKCIVSKIDESYYWASRENVTLLRLDLGAFTTFIAANGSGYIRIVNPDMKDAASLMSETETEYDYVEHLLLGLRSITYYGTYE